jgi:hypothetical protein
LRGESFPMETESSAAPMSEAALGGDGSRGASLAGE